MATTPINIVVNNKEDYIKYTNSLSCKNHNIIYDNKLRGLLDQRNYILKNNDDWVLMLDDDINSIHKRTNDDNFKVDWNYFLTEINDIVMQLEIEKVALIVFNETGYFFRKQDRPRFSNCKSAMYYSAAIMNTKLLKNKKIRFSGYLNQRAICEDTDLCCQIIKNDLTFVRINSVIPNKIINNISMVWSNDREIRKQEQLNGIIWLFKKYINNNNVFKYLMKMCCSKNKILSAWRGLTKKEIEILLNN